MKQNSFMGFLTRSGIIICMFLQSSIAIAQNWHVSGRIGFSNYQGDLQDRRLALSQAKLTGSLGLRYDISEHLTARTFVSLGTLMATDGNNKSAELRKRNLDFHSRLIDLELGAQYQIFSLNNKWWTPYVFAGIGMFNFKPATRTNAGDKVFLAPLSTEGQGFVNGRDPYSLWQFMIPFGVGAEYLITEDLRVGLEFGYRATFTDYIDDVSGTYASPELLYLEKGETSAIMSNRSLDGLNKTGLQRGNSKNKDWYAVFGITLTYQIKQNCGCSI
jgi:hypothetical protein